MILIFGLPCAADVSKVWMPLWECRKETEQLVCFHLRKKSMLRLHPFEGTFISF